MSRSLREPVVAAVFLCGISVKAFANEDVQEYVKKLVMYGENGSKVELACGMQEELCAVTVWMHGKRYRFDKEAFRSLGTMLADSVALYPSTGPDSFRIELHYACPEETYETYGEMQCHALVDVDKGRIERINLFGQYDAKTAYLSAIACETSGAKTVFYFDVSKPPPSVVHVTKRLDLALTRDDRGWKLVAQDANTHASLLERAPHGPSEYEMSAWLIQSQFLPNVRTIPLRKYGGEIIMDLREIGTKGEGEATDYAGGLGHICWKPVRVSG